MKIEYEGNTTKLKLCLALLVSLMVFAPAQQKLLIGCTATADCSSAMIAVNEGIFKRLDVDAERGLIAIASNAPAALLSSSIQIGGPTAPLFLQAVDGGLDLVAVSGASVMYELTARTTAAHLPRSEKPKRQYLAALPILCSRATFLRRIRIAPD